MSQSYNGNTTGLSGRPTVTITEPTGTDVRNSASIRTPVERLADFIQYLMTNAALKVLDAALDAGGFKIANLGAPTVAGDAVRVPVARQHLGAVGQVASSGSGAFSTTSATYVDVTNLSVTITTTGHPVALALVSDPASSNAGLLSIQSGIAQMSIQALRGATKVAESMLWHNQAGMILAVPPTGLLAIDPVAAGTYTYKLQAKISNGVTGWVGYCVLIAYEM